MTDADLIEIERRFRVAEQAIDFAHFRSVGEKIEVLNRIDVCRADLERMQSFIRGKVRE